MYEVATISVFDSIAFRSAFSFHVLRTDGLRSVTRYSSMYICSEHRRLLRVPARDPILLDSAPPPMRAPILPAEARAATPKWDTLGGRRLPAGGQELGLLI